MSNEPCFLTQGVEFAPTGIASPNLSGITQAVETLPPEERARFYAGFLEDPFSPEYSPNIQIGTPTVPKNQ
jgi:hypothetical protein